MKKICFAKKLFHLDGVIQTTAHILPKLCYPWLDNVAQVESRQSWNWT